MPILIKHLKYADVLLSIAVGKKDKLEKSLSHL